MMDETSLVYVVMEPTEADLSEILRERPLTLAETREVAGSLIPAVEALHASGFVHEHIQPANVLAVAKSSSCAATAFAKLRKALKAMPCAPAMSRTSRRCSCKR